MSQPLAPERRGGQGLDPNQEESGNLAILKLLTSDEGRAWTDFVATCRQGPDGAGAYEAWASRGMVRWTRHHAPGGGYEYPVMEVVGENPLEPILRRPRVVELPDLGVDDLLESGQLSPEEYEELSRLDVIVQGEDRRTGTPGQVLLAVDVSTQIRESDIRRAQRRALILQGIGKPAIPVVGGEKMGPAARKQAEAAGVIVHLVPRD